MLLSFHFVGFILGLHCLGSAGFKTPGSYEKHTCDPFVLERRCRTNVPRFVTFAFTEIGDKRWKRGVEDLKKSILYMYSSLVRSHLCVPTLYIYTNEPDQFTSENAISRTTMRTKTNIVVRNHAMADINSHFYVNKWKGMSRYKLDIVTSHLINGERMVWIDADTLVFTNLTPAFLKSPSWVIGWQHGKSKSGSSVISDITIPDEFNSQGDLWAVNLPAIKEIENLETQLVKKSSSNLPLYDLQGYFSILMTQGSTNFKLLQKIMPEFNFGFHCSNYNHPNITNFTPYVEHGNHLHCTDKQGLGFPKEIGAISFTSLTFKAMVLDTNGIVTQSTSVRRWFRRFFFCE
jgi:hypothetical protein